MSRISQSGLRTIRVLDALKGHTLHGMSNVDLAKTLDESPSNINRCLNTLIEAGYAMQLENGRFSQGMKMLQNAQAFANEIANSQSRIDELTQRVHAGAHS